MKCKYCGNEIIGKFEWMKVKVLGKNIEIMKEITHKGKSFEEIQKLIPEGCILPTYFELQELRNSDKIDELHLRDTWEFVENPDKIAKENGFVARFFANSGVADLYCDGVPRLSVAGLGVRFVRDINSKDKTKNVKNK